MIEANAEITFAGKRYAYKFDFAGLAAATQPQATDASYKYQSDLFMSPYHGAKLSSFMSPHHSMASSSGECLSPTVLPLRLLPTANTLSRPSIDSEPPHRNSRRSIKIKFSNQFPIVIRQFSYFPRSLSLAISAALSGASQPKPLSTPVDRRPIIVRHCVSDFRSGYHFSTVGT